jgi:hypothetical protein
MSISVSGTTYTSSVSDITVTSGEASKTTGGGREITILIFTSAIVGMGMAIPSAKKRLTPKVTFSFC